MIWIHLTTYGSRALVDLGRLFSFLIYTESLGLLVRRIIPSQGRTAQTQNKRTDIHVSSGIRTQYPNVEAAEDHSCIRPHGDCDRPIWINTDFNEYY
jgi:hypothetical protein